MITGNEITFFLRENSQGKSKNADSLIYGPNRNYSVIRKKRLVLYAKIVDLPLICSYNVLKKFCKWNASWKSRMKIDICKSIILMNVEFYVVFLLKGGLR
jgi:hypothetical protein